MSIKEQLSTKGEGYYVVATRSNSFISKAIRWFSRKGSSLDEYDHITIVHKGTEIHMTTPHVEMRPFDYRNYNDVWKIRYMPERAWSNALRIYDRHLEDKRYGRYGKAQLVSKNAYFFFLYITIEWIPTIH